MNVLSSQQKALILLAPLLVIVQVIAFQLFDLWDHTWGYLLGFLFYWFLWCIPLTIIVCFKRKIGLKQLYAPIVDQQSNLVALFLVFLPAVSTGIVVFSEYVTIVDRNVIFLALLFALINAPLEELLWRKVYPMIFPRSIWWGFLYPTICFTAWHFAPALVRDSGMEGGITAFVGGALFMGLVWGWYSYRYQTIIPSTIAHILTNFFAFTGFLHVNFFA
ncbi:CPBP family intramembrane glutamic endopeptidase [Risungbinella massiliensis]|uniref:CPBP family intramembrane glutamic endopeptidase n=1 Tax=Risungbinella massiliensis TaxID=1329796 RepID=UPI0005CC08B7|nr:CPBP family intramembrane glutamic endopeptidase [Risungbinella massiliensis]